MTVASIITNALQAIPPRLRFGVLVVFAAVVVATQVAEAFSVDVHEGVYRTLVLIGGYLGVQSAANVTEER